jgi:hypothetical protein
MTENDFIEKTFSDLEEFYPGSKKKRRPFDEIPENTKELDTSWESNYYEKTLPNGRKIQMYTIGSLAQALGRPVITVRTWIKEGYLPASPYRLPTKPDKNGFARAGRRLYSKAMIDSAVQVFKQNGLFDILRVEWKNHSQVPLEIAETWNQIRVQEKEND